MKRRYAIVDVEDVLPKIATDSWGKKSRAVIRGWSVRNNSLRLRTFKEKGIICVSCGLIGEFFAIEGHGRPHLGLYGIKDGKEVLMTKDHIRPKAKGGRDTLFNMQPMCAPCNVKKGSKWKS